MKYLTTIHYFYLAFGAAGIELPRVAASFPPSWMPAINGLSAGFSLLSFVLGITFAFQPSVTPNVDPQIPPASAPAAQKAA